jgi:hypothetical protein
VHRPARSCGRAQPRADKRSPDWPQRNPAADFRFAQAELLTAQTFSLQRTPDLIQNHRIVDRRQHLPRIAVGDLLDRPAPIRRLRHELRNTLRPLGAHRLRLEAALLPDHAGEEFDGKAVRRGVLLDGAADVVRGRRVVWRSKRSPD